MLADHVDISQSFTQGYFQSRDRYLGNLYISAPGLPLLPVILSTRHIAIAYPSLFMTCPEQLALGFKPSSHSSKNMAMERSDMSKACVRLE